VKEPKTIKARLDGGYNVLFTLEFSQDKDGNEIGILTAPFKLWCGFDSVVETRIFELSGRLLQCIEKQYFDNNVIVIPIKDHPYPIELEDVIYHQVIPKKIYNQMLNGTYRIADGADKSVYGNMPVKVAKSAKTDGQPEYKTIEDPGMAVALEWTKEMSPELGEMLGQMLDGTYKADDAGKPKRGKKRK
jgi:hypothetical protein